MAVVAAEVCPLIQQRCAGVNQQYDSVGDCMAKLESKSFGSFDEIWGDNIACRVIHLILTQMRPEVNFSPRNANISADTSPRYTVPMLVRMAEMAQTISSAWILTIVWTTLTMAPCLAVLLSIAPAIHLTPRCRRAEDGFNRRAGEY